MAFYCVEMLNIALDLAVHDDTYEDMASKFFEHFTQISDAINQMSDGVGLWDNVDGFYYDHLSTDTCSLPLRVRSMVGLVPLMACLVLDDEYMDRLPGFRKRLNWFMKNRRDLASQVSVRSVYGVIMRLIAGKFSRHGVARALTDFSRLLLCRLIPACSVTLRNWREIFTP